MKLIARQKAIKSELDRLNRWNMAYYPPATISISAEKPRQKEKTA